MTVYFTLKEGYVAEPHPIRFPAWDTDKAQAFAKAVYEYSIDGSCRLQPVKRERENDVREAVRIFRAAGVRIEES